MVALTPVDQKSSMLPVEAPVASRVRARLWVYPPHMRMGNVPAEAIRAAANAGVDIEIGEVSIGIEGDSHAVFAAIEKIFFGMGPGNDVALIATVHRP